MFRLKVFVIYLLGITTVLLSSDLQASHIRAGELTVFKVSSFSNVYRIRLTVYRDTDGVEFKFGTLDFGDESGIENFTDEDGPTSYLISRENVGEKIDKHIYETLHEYIETSGDFIVSFKEEFRNNDIRNVNANTPFYVETKFRISPLTGQNSSPILTIPPVDKGTSKQLYIHNPGAYDPDGDKLFFELITPFQRKEEEIAGYRFPNSPRFYTDFETGNSESTGPPTISIDPDNGNLIWDSPGEEGEYNVAFKVYELREVNGVFDTIGYVIRDMQITIEPSDNDAPKIDPIAPICINAGETGTKTVTATDINTNDKILLEAFGLPFEEELDVSLSPDPDTSPPPFQFSPASLIFTWNTRYEEARAAFYDVIIKAQDNGSPPLVDLAGFFVEVAAPAPTGVVVVEDGPLSAKLDWDNYRSFIDNSRVQVWRRNGSFDFTPDDCETGIPLGGDYELVKLAALDSNTFTDTNLSSGTEYCYRLVAGYFGKYGPGLSYASEEVCLVTGIVEPLILNVDVLKNADGSDMGDLFVKWSAPADLDSALFTRPLTYVLSYQKDGVISALNEPSTDTTFIVKDTDLTDRTGSYFVEVYNTTGDTLYATSEAAPIIQLDIDQTGNDSRLKFNANVPWNVRDNQSHLVYRNNVDPGDPEKLVLIDSTTSLTYVDTSFQEKKVEYCYYITTRGAYDDSRIESPLENRTPNACAYISDSVNTCFPVLSPFESCKNSLTSTPCQAEEFPSLVAWSFDKDREECVDLKEFAVLFSPNCDEIYDTLAFIPSTEETSYIHNGVESLDGCYLIVSLNFLAKAGLSNIEEKDGSGCQQLVFPNIFTPNGDGHNDVYNPFNDVEDLINGTAPTNISPKDCPRFVQSYSFNIYDRTGNQLFTFQSPVGDPFLKQPDLLINWDGKSKQGKELPTGTYYYGAEIFFYNFGKERIKENKRGWIQLRK